MKHVCIAITWSILLTVGPAPSALAGQQEAAFPTPSGSAMAVVPVADFLQAGQTVIAFLNWYKTHIQAVNRWPLVNQPVGKPYSVNFKNGERYLACLKSSHFLTDGYLNQWRTYFREHNANFRRNPQDEGPPDGFEYDLVMLNQDVEKQLASLNSLKINKITIVSNQATVALTLFDAYEFRLVRQNNRWVINEIQFSSQQ